MSNFMRNTKHPYTGKWEMAAWLDNQFGHRIYGVRFQDGKVFNTEKIPIEFKD